MTEPTPRPTRRRWRRRLGIGLAVVVVLAVGIPFVFIHFVEGKAPDKLALRSGSAAVDTGPLSLDGAWHVGSDSLVGYRVNEVLVGQHTTAVGRTSDVSGQLAFSGTTLSTATFTADMATVKSDQTGRDRQFRGRIMDTATYPTATFTLSAPVTVGPDLASGKVQTEKVTGNLQLHGQTHPVTFDLSAVHVTSGIDVQGAIPVTFATWGIDNPSFGFVTTEDHGTLEFLLHLVSGAGAAVASPSTSTTVAGGSGGGGSGSGGAGSGSGSPGGGGPPPGGGSGGGGGMPSIKVPSTTTPSLTLPSGG